MLLANRQNAQGAQLGLDAADGGGGVSFILLLNLHVSAFMRCISRKWRRPIKNQSFIFANNFVDACDFVQYMKNVK